MARLGEMLTRVAGSMSGPDADKRQRGLAVIQALIAGGRYVPLLLVPEPTNPFDADAVKVEVALPELGIVQLGYIKNSDGVCDLCNKPFSRFPKQCSGCRRADYLRRDGAATRISQALRECPELQLVGEIMEITGGTAEKESFGCNLRVVPIYPDTVRPDTVRPETAR